MRGKYVDLTGVRIGRLTVVSRAPNDLRGKPRWNCKCDCGNSCLVSSTALLSGYTHSCGCLRRERAAVSHAKHGGCKRSRRDRLYGVWNSMKQRCENPRSSSYENYGGRGIAVCAEWKNSYEAFRSWAIDNGYDPDTDPGLCTIDRIDVDGDYEPSNCRWADAKKQANNCRNNRRVTAFGKTQTAAEWADETGIKYPTILFRLRNGWDPETALTLPPQVGRNQTWRE